MKHKKVRILKRTIENCLNNVLANKPEKLNELKKTPLIIVTADVPAPNPVKKSLNIKPNEPRAPKKHA